MNLPTSLAWLEHSAEGPRNIAHRLREAQELCSQAFPDASLLLTLSLPCSLPPRTAQFQLVTQGHVPGQI